jgi:hypothetical protein
MAAHKHAIVIVAILSIVASLAAACSSDAKRAVSSSSASQQSIDELTARVQRDEMLNAWVTISSMPLHDLDAELQGGKIDGKYVPTLRTLIRLLALTAWPSELASFTNTMRDHAVALYKGLNNGEEASALKDRSAAMHVDGDAFGATVGNVVGKDLPADAGGPGPKANTPASGTASIPTPHS